MNDILDDDDLDYVQKYKNRGFLIWTIIFTVGYAFKIMHWPGASFIMLVSGGGFTAYSYAAFMKDKSRISVIFSILSTIWIILLGVGHFTIGRFPFNQEAVISHVVSVVIFVTIYFAFKK